MLLLVWIASRFRVSAAAMELVSRATLMIWSFSRFVFLALGVHHVNIIEVTTLHVLIVMVISLFPVPGGAGGAEFSFDVIFSLYIHSGTKLVLAMILWRIVTYYFGMFLGMVALVQKPKKVQRVDLTAE